MVNGQSQSGPRPEPTGNDIADYAQLFAAVLTVVGLLLSATGVTDFFRNLVTVLIAIASCNIVIYLLRHRNHLASRRILVRAGANVIVVVSSVLLAVALPKPGGNSTTSSGLPPAGGSTTDGGQPVQQAAAAPAPILDKKSYPLQRSASIDTNDQDKVDLDTACPGWGGMSIRVGPRRCGELADLIVDEEGIHTPEGKPQLLRSPPERAGYETCRTMLGQRINDRASIVETKDLKPGGTLCVETDKRNIAMVRVDEVGLDESGDLEKVKISFLVWSP